MHSSERGEEDADVSLSQVCMNQKLLLLVLQLNRPVPNYGLLLLKKSHFMLFLLLLLILLFLRYIHVDDDGSRISKTSSTIFFMSDFWHVASHIFSIKFLKDDLLMTLPIIITICKSSLHLLISGPKKFHFSFQK